MKKMGLKGRRYNSTWYSCLYTGILFSLVISLSSYGQEVNILEDIHVDIDIDTQSDTYSDTYNDTEADVDADADPCLYNIDKNKTLNTALTISNILHALKNEPEGDSNKKIRKCLNNLKCISVVQELYTTEIKYLGDLDLIISSLQEATLLNKGYSKPPTLFNHLLPRLISLRSNVSDYTQSIAKVILGEKSWEGLIPDNQYFKQTSQILKLYKIHNNQLGDYRKNGDFIFLLENILSSKGNIGFNHSLIKTAQRPPRLLLLLKEIENNFPSPRYPGMEHYKTIRSLKRIILKISKEVNAINDDLKYFENEIFDNPNVLNIYLDSSIQTQDQFLSDDQSLFKKERFVNIINELNSKDGIGTDQLPSEELNSLKLMPLKVRKAFYKRIKLLLKIIPQYYSLSYQKRIKFFNNYKVIKVAHENNINIEKLPVSYQNEIFNSFGQRPLLSIETIKDILEVTRKSPLEGNNPYLEYHLNLARNNILKKEVKEQGINFNLLPQDLKEKVQAASRNDRTIYLKKILSYLKAKIPYSTLTASFWDFQIFSLNHNKIKNDINKNGLNYSTIPLDLKIQISKLHGQNRTSFLKLIHSIIKDEGISFLTREKDLRDKILEKYSKKIVQEEAHHQKILVEFNLLTTKEKDQLAKLPADQRKEALKRLKDNSLFGRNYLTF